jgi:hypothetical protein
MKNTVKRGDSFEIGRMALPLAGPNDGLGLNCNLFNADFPASF